MMMIRRTAATALFATLALICSGIAMAYEEPEYTVVTSINGVEYRQYEPYLVAETHVEGIEDRDKAANVGFRRLFRYISGENVVRLMDTEAGASESSKKISMTTPVRQTPAENGWTVAFVVPQSYDETSVPAPTNPDVTIRSVPGLMTAVWTYSGRWTDRVAAANRQALLARLEEAGIEPEGEVVTAYYNSPFTLPFLRRNEVMVPVGHVPRTH